MKKIIAFIGIIVLGLSGVSCVKEISDGNNAFPPEDGTIVKLSVSEAGLADVRSSYTPGTGIRLSQAEKIALLYDDGALLVGNASYSIVASPEGAGSYSFTAPAGGLDKTWYGIVPYSYDLTRARINTNQRLMITFNSVQYPGQNTFDPATDILVSRPFTIDGDAGAKTATISSFKRLTAPFKLQITGLEDSEKIYAVTFDLSQISNGTATNTMACRCLYTVGNSPDDFAFDSVQLTGTRSNAISAIYDEGLVKEGGCWPVWFNVRPITITASKNITVTVFTADACYKRTVPINAGTFSTDHINTFTIDIKGAGYTSEPAISQSFFSSGLTNATSITSSATETSVSLTATDGVARTWELKGYNWTAAKLDGGSTLPDAVGFPKGQDAYIKIPAVAGNTIKKVRLYLHPLSHHETNDYDLTVYDGETLLHTIQSVSALDISRGYTRGGFIELDSDAIAGISDFTGLKLKFGACGRNAAALISRIVLFTNVAAVEGDYYQDFLDGKNIVIGNQTYNIGDDDIAYTYLDTDDYLDFRHAVMANDIVFVNNALTITQNDGNGIELTRPRPTAIVGRYKLGQGQPVIDMGAKFFQVLGGGVALLNVRMKSTDNSHGMFTDAPSATTPPINNCLNIIDCTIDISQYLYRAQDQFNAAVTSYIIDNSIISIAYTSNAASFFEVNTGQDDALLPYYRKISVTNSVFYGTVNDVNSFRFFTTSVVPQSGGYGNYENLDFIFKNNSIYNLAPRMVICASGTKSVVIDKNVMFGTFKGSDASMSLFRTFSYPGATDKEYVYPEAATSSLSDNTVHFTGSTPWNPYFPGKAEDTWFTISGNAVEYNQAVNTVFGTCDAANLYFPVNTSVVTNGGGATYTTKLWRVWE